MMRRVALLILSVICATTCLALPLHAWGQDLETLFAEAEALFRSADQPMSIELFTTVIASVEAQGELTLELQDLLVRALAHRAEATYNLGAVDAAEADLRRLIEVMPAAELDRDFVSPKLLELFDAARAEIVGFLDLMIAPSDAAVLVDGERNYSWVAGPVALVAGPHVVSVEKPGHDPVQTEIDVIAGEVLSFEAALVRTGAVLYVSSRPAGARVTVAGRDFGSTGEDGLVVDGLPVGEHELVVELDGYRTERAQVQVPALSDYRLDPIVLEPTVGELVLEGVPEGSAIRLDGSSVSSPVAGDGSARFSLAPGDYLLEVEHPVMGTFESTVTVVDAREVRVPVRIRTTVVYLGVLGGDDVGRETLNAAIAQVIAESDDWSLADRSGLAGSLFASAGLDAATLRLAEDAETQQGFPQLRLSAIEQFPGSVYVFGVLSDDLVARQADLWAWSRAAVEFPVDRVRVPLVEASTSDAVAQGVFSVDELVCPTSGMQLADTDVGGAPVVVMVDLGGPAESAGVKAGDLVRAVSGEAVASTAEIDRWFRSATPGATVPLRLDRAGSQLDVEVVTGSGYCMVEPNRQDYLYGVAMAQIESMLARGASTVPEWLLHLNKAQLLMQVGQWDEAVRVLRRVDAPERPGLGRGTADYMTGVALSMIGPDYLSSARDALRRAEASTGARLGSDRGLPIASLARAMLAGLER